MEVNVILIIDNYDSFTQNLVQCVGQLDFDVLVYRNNDITTNDINLLDPTHIILSPGPGNPINTGISLELIDHYANTIPILGVCLGHQSIGYAYGAKIKPLTQPIHGKISEIWHNNLDLFANLPNPFLATRYHSLVVDREDLPNNIQITAWTDDGLIMACRHKKYKLLRGIQFHPESLWTQNGKNIMENFLLT